MSFLQQQMIRIIIQSFFLVIVCNKIDNISIPQAGCTFIVQSSNSTGFNFQTCSTPNNLANSDWSQCITECCPTQSPTNIPSLNTLLSCKQKSSVTQSLGLTSIIVFSVLAIIATTIFVCFCGIVIKLVKSLQRNRVSQQNEDNLTIEWQSQQQNLTKFTNQLKWCNKNRDKSKIIQESTCSICLEELPNTELYCKHIYHPRCIGIWLKKSNFCPLCHREDIRSVKIYCDQCKTQYIICRRGFLINNSSSINLKCFSCSQANKQISIEIEGIQEMEYPPTQSLIFELSSQHLASPH